MKIFIAFTLCSISLLFVLFGGNKKQNLKISEEYKLKVPEPSGLCFSYDQKYLWTVSDQNSTVYLIDLKGKIINSFKIKAEDLEGITVLNDSTIAAVSERSGEIIFSNNSGKEYKRFKLPFEGKDNKGVEGISYDSNTGRIFIVKEKKPKILLQYDSKLKESNKSEIKFADDLSGLDYVEKTNELWIISDESKLLAKCTADGKLKEKFFVKITQIEGIAVDYKNKKIFLVSDKEEKLYVVNYK